jgi:hypothetical protein
MPRTPAKFTQADLARAIRAMKQTFGSASVVFETDGTVRVVPGAAAEPVTPSDSLGDEEILGKLGTSWEEYRAREEEWKKELPALPLGKRERKVLEELSNHGVGKPVDWRQIKSCGPDTLQRLEIRGFVEIQPNKKFPDRAGNPILTAAGAAAVLEK